MSNPSTATAKESLTLKWGTLKAWDLKSDASLAAFKKYTSSGSNSMSAMMQHDNAAQKEAICELIDALNAGEVFLDWDGVYVSKDKAKEYVRNYGKK